MSRLRWLFPLLAFSVVLWGQAPQLAKRAAATQFSRARIVRISLAQGTVEINQQDGRGWQRVAINAPLTQADQVRTGVDGRAEVEFEAGSTVKLIPNGELTFQRLELAPDGEHLSDVAVTQGTAFFTLNDHDAPGFRALFPEGVATAPDNKARFRVTVANGTGEVRVLDGKAEVAAANDSYLLKKNDLLALTATAPAALAKVRAEDSWDEWSQALDKQAGGQAIKAQLANYGQWQGGWWHPSGVAAGWNPYMNGAWFFDPTLGYMWDSFYDWGWAPFHYGMWWDSPSGWAWSPLGGSFFMGGPLLVTTGMGGTAAGLKVPTPPPTPPIHRVAVAGIATVRSNGAVASARTLGTPGWYQAHAGMGRMNRAGISGSAAMARMDSNQMAALKRARSTASFDRQQAMWAHWRQNQARMMRESNPSWTAGMPGSRAASAGSMSMPSASPVMRTGPMPTASPAAHASGGARIPR